MTRNRFFSYNNGDLEDSKIRTEKHRAVFIMQSLEILVRFKGDISKMKKEYPKAYRSILNESFSGPAAKKLTSLVIALKQHPEYRETFMKSSVVECFMKPLLRGHTDKSAERQRQNDWDQYIMKIESNATIQGFTIYDKATDCYRSSDSKTPIGVDFNEILSTIVKGEKIHAVVRDSATEETKRLLLQAAGLQIDNMKNTPNFANNFVIESESENESE